MLAASKSVSMAMAGLGDLFGAATEHAVSAKTTASSPAEPWRRAAGGMCGRSFRFLHGRSRDAAGRSRLREKGIALDRRRRNYVLGVLSIPQTASSPSQNEALVN